MLLHNDYIYYFPVPPTQQPPSETCVKTGYQTLIGYDLFAIPGTPPALTAPSSK